MALTSDKLEEIVRQVLQELRAGQVARPAAAVAPAAATSSVPVSAARVGAAPAVLTSADVVAISDRAVTESVLANAGAAGRTVSLVRGAVLTPSARDYIRRHNVRLSTAVTATASVSAAAFAGAVVIVGRESTVRMAAAAVGWPVREVADNFSAARAAQELLPVKRVLCVCPSPAIAACVLNRDSAIRAAVLERAVGMERLLEQMQPQAVCLQSEGWGYPELSRLLGLMQRPLQQPAGWSEQQWGGVR